MGTGSRWRGGGGGTTKLGDIKGERERVRMIGPRMEKRVHLEYWCISNGPAREESGRIS